MKEEEGGNSVFPFPSNPSSKLLVTRSEVPIHAFQRPKTLNPAIPISSHTVKAQKDNMDSTNEVPATLLNITRQIRIKVKCLTQPFISNHKSL
jgi:hypothetical protein